jgi:hypothetical protein
MSDDGRGLGKAWQENHASDRVIIDGNKCAIHESINGMLLYCEYCTVLRLSTAQHRLVYDPRSLVSRFTATIRLFRRSFTTRVMPGHRRAEAHAFGAFVKLMDQDLISARVIDHLPH